MPFLAFLRANGRWLAGGFLLCFFSSFGQTFFIAMSAGEIRAEFGLSHGDFGTLYMLATLASALTLPRLGQVVDRRPLRTVAAATIPLLAFACVLMAYSRHIVVLAVAIYMLRLLGQGMMTHMSFTAMGRWFSAQRGRAVSVVTLGHNVGEALFPIIAVTMFTMIGWRDTWFVAAAALVLVALPVVVGLVAVERTPQTSDPSPTASPARDWTRGEVIRDPIFYLLLFGVMGPGFIGTTIFFHQVYLVELRGWPIGIFASSFSLMAAMTIVFALVSGQLIDRFSGVALLRWFLLPLGAACFVLGWFDGAWSAFAFMGLLGLSYGFSSTLFGALWPEIYGTKNLGAIRAMVVAIMVFATAMGPGLTGYLIDHGVDYPAQILAMGIYCVCVSVLMVYVSRTVRGRRLPTPEPSVSPRP
ncbi:MAG: MFS transporter [Rhizobiaceae bacterium]